MVSKYRGFCSFMVSPFEFDKIHLSINKTVKSGQNHRLNHERESQFGKKLTVKGQGVVDLADLSIFNGQDVQRRGMIDSLLIDLIDRVRWRAIEMQRLKTDLEWIHA